MRSLLDAIAPDPRTRLAGRPVERAAHFVRLLASSRLVLDADASTRALLRDALPSERPRWDGKPLGVISARVEDARAGDPPEIAPTMRVSGISTWVDHPASGLSLVRNARGSVNATVDRGARRATLRVWGDLEHDERVDAGVALGITITLLAGHVGHAVVHAGAVVPPGGVSCRRAARARASRARAPSPCARRA